ncbi:hypothetical protein AU252_10165 [Pseudarthrobacter sulfonivorans]|uniref:Uncharacterized protein n=1 Tax=Pseudarthrobacter sulfonivorans TaxID=121292 RepID=A0A0U3QAS5_9MICC|nr:hypothetical protein AU252_10165 [Pseudarthrobacter sulfonivorans]
MGVIDFILTPSAQDFSGRSKDRYTRVSTLDQNDKRQFDGEAREFGISQAAPHSIYARRRIEWLTPTLRPKE